MACWPQDHQVVVLGLWTLRMPCGVWYSLWDHQTWGLENNDFNYLCPGNCQSFVGQLYRKNIPFPIAHPGRSFSHAWCHFDIFSLEISNPAMENLTTLRQISTFETSYR